ncbi:MAG: methyltransferase domain-containing protein [Sedimenticola sp.]
MPDKPSWEKFFDTHAPLYEENVFTRNTKQEADFLEEELALPGGSTILDVGCGTGRHAIEMARRGYRLTGLDLSAGMLAKAREGAERAGVELELIHADATRFSLGRQYDAAICLCEGAFGLLGAEDDPIEQPLSILRNISQSLKPGAKVILTVLNAAAMIRRYQNSDVAEGRFDPVRLVESGTLSPAEDEPPIATRERGFVPTELTLLCSLAGLSVLNIWGGTAGNWGRRSIDLDEIEIMLVARKADKQGSKAT